jgi:hypothetical protein
MINPSMTGETGLGFSGLFFGKAVARVARIALTVFAADGMTPTASLLRIDHLRRQFQDLLESIN